MSNGGKHFLLYDEHCSLCVRFKEAVQRRDRQGRIEPVGFEDPRIPRLVPGIPQERLRSSFHLVLPEGRLLSGHRALPELLSLLPGGSLPAWFLRHAPGAPWLSKRLYAWIAEHRG